MVFFFRWLVVMNIVVVVYKFSISVSDVDNVVFSLLIICCINELLYFLGEFDYNLGFFLLLVKVYLFLIGLVCLYVFIWE